MPQVATPGAKLPYRFGMTTYTTNEHGAVESHNLAADTQVSAKALFAALDGIGGQGKVQLRPQRAPVDAVRNSSGSAGVRETIRLLSLADFQAWR
jgi:hypothetical protein